MEFVSSASDLKVAGGWEGRDSYVGRPRGGGAEGEVCRLLLPSLGLPKCPGCMDSPASQEGKPGDLFTRSVWEECRLLGELASALAKRMNC